MSRTGMQIFLDVALAIAILLLVLIGLNARAFAAGGGPVDAGRVIVSEHCSSCHAIGPAGQSPNAAAPPLRKLAERYPDAALTDALEKGLLDNHPAMPTFRFSHDELTAILAYLHSIQEVRGA